MPGPPSPPARAGSAAAGRQPGAACSTRHAAASNHAPQQPRVVRQRRRRPRPAAARARLVQRSAAGPSWKRAACEQPLGTLRTGSTVCAGCPVPQRAPGCALCSGPHPAAGIVPARHGGEGMAARPVCRKNSRPAWGDRMAWAEARLWAVMVAQAVQLPQRALNCAAVGGVGGVLPIHVHARIHILRAAWGGPGEACGGLIGRRPARRARLGLGAGGGARRPVQQHAARRVPAQQVVHKRQRNQRACRTGSRVSIDSMSALIVEPFCPAFPQFAWSGHLHHVPQQNFGKSLACRGRSRRKVAYVTLVF